MASTPDRRFVGRFQVVGDDRCAYWVEASRNFSADGDDLEPTITLDGEELEWIERGKYRTKGGVILWTDHPGAV